MAEEIHILEGMATVDGDTLVDGYPLTEWIKGIQGIAEAPEDRERWNIKVELRLSRSRRHGTSPRMKKLHDGGRGE